MKKNKIGILLLLCLWSMAAILPAQETRTDDKGFTVSGIVIDTEGEPLSNATIKLLDKEGQGVVSDIDGKFTLKNLPKNTRLEFSFVGFKKQVYTVTKSVTGLKVKLEPEAQEIDEFVVVAHGVQRKVSVVGAITTVNPKELDVPSTSVSNMLGGLVPGVVAIDRSGEPGKDFSEFWVRGISTFGASAAALVLIDGIEGNINDINPSDIESFSILKDASSTAVYGVRGANGVVVITTKRGVEGKMSINWKSSASYSYSPRMPQYLEAYDYAALANEARVVRGLEPKYSPTDMEIIKYGLDEDLFPNVNWRKEILRNSSLNQDHYVGVRGGGKIARYFLSLGSAIRDGIFKQDKSVNSYGTNVKWHKYNFRVNVDGNITPTTVVGINMDATIIDSRSPGFGSDNNALWWAQSMLTPLTVPVRYSTGQLPAFGNNDDQTSPYVLLNYTGFRTGYRSTIRTNLSLNQNLNFITKGLNARALFSFYNNNTVDTRRYKMPELFRARGRYNDGSLLIERTRSATNIQQSGNEASNRQFFFETQATYDRSVDKHRFGALLHYYMQDDQNSKSGDVIATIPKRYQALSARATYSFKDTYIVEANAGYTGSENFQKGKQFGLFPSIALGWVPTNYAFMNKHLPFLNFFKIRGSYGQVGNDRIGGGRRFPYLTTVNFNSGNAWNGSGISENQVGADNLYWEVAQKYNLGIDFQFLQNKMGGTVDIFKDVRNNIFQERQMLPFEAGAVNPPFTNVGKMRSGGVDGNIYVNHKFTNDLSMTARANMTYAKGEVVHWDQPLFRYPYQSYSGVPIYVNRGLVAMGLFTDSLQILSAPKQTFGEVRPGDIRYKDVNGDGKIDDDDRVPISYSAIPEIQYGFALEVKYRKFTVSALFTGMSKVNYFYGGAGFHPFIQQEAGNVLTIANDRGNRWTPAWYSGDPTTENPDARFPRLTYGNSANNNRNSTFWLADGKHIRFKTLDISYRLDGEFLQRRGITAIHLQLIGHNLATFDNVKLWDPGQASSNGAAYPLQRTFSGQITINF